MSISRRHSIWWPNSEREESEPTSTLVLTSPSGLYVDVRVLKSEGLDLTFDWYFAGFEIPHDESSIEFNHDFLDSNYITHYYSNNKSSAFQINADVGHFKDSDDVNERNAGIRVETGEMENPKTHTVEPYVEKWITCDPHCLELKYLPASDDLPTVKCIVIDTVHGGVTDNENVSDVYIGRIIVYGDWTQGILWHKGGLPSVEKDNVGILRAFRGETIIGYGAQLENLIMAAEKTMEITGGTPARFKVGGIEWMVKEYSS